MSRLSGKRNSLSLVRGNSARHDHQFNSWLSPLHQWLERSERARQRADLRAIAGDPHLLDDLGLTRETALQQANKPFWD